MRMRRGTLIRPGWWVFVYLLVILIINPILPDKKSSIKGAEAKLIRTAVVMRVAPFGAFTRVNEEDEATQPLRKLSGEETLMAVRIGKKLRELYVRASKVIPPRYDDDALDLVSTESVRATQAAQALGIGLFDRGGDNTFFELPPSRHLQGNAKEIFEQCLSYDKDPPPQSLLQDQMHYWNEFKRFFHVQADDRYVFDVPPSWVFESAYESLRSSSAAYRDDALLNRARAIGTTILNTREIKPSRLMQEILYNHFHPKTLDSPSMKIYVIDNNDVMQDLLGSTLLTHEASSVVFPLPRVVSFELHDESDIDPNSDVKFIRILLDFVPVTCSAAGEFLCSLETYLSHPRRNSMASEEWRERCRVSSLSPTHTPTSSPTMPTSLSEEKQQGEAQSKEFQHKEVNEQDAKHISSQNEDTKAQDEPKPTCAPNTVDSTSEEEFIHGFLWGLALAATVFACRCSPRKHEDIAYYAEVDEQVLQQPQQDLYPPSLGDIEGRHHWSIDDEVGMSPMRGPVDPAVLGVDKSPHVQPLLSRPIAHIPRPKPSNSSLGGTSVSSSPMCGPIRNTDD